MPDETDLFKSIDGNPIINPVGFCTYHKGYVSYNQARTHKCFRKHGGACGRIMDMKGRYVKNMNQQQYFDKTIDRLTKMETALNRMGRSLENISNTLDDMKRNEALLIEASQGDPEVVPDSFFPTEK